MLSEVIDSVNSSMEQQTPVVNYAKFELSVSWSDAPTIKGVTDDDGHDEGDLQHDYYGDM